MFEILQKDPKVPRANSTKEQAVRTAWRIVKDWVEAQMALVETRMVTTQQVFLTYAVMKDGRTLSEHVQSDPKFLLGDGAHETDLRLYQIRNLYKFLHQHANAGLYLSEIR